MGAQNYLVPNGNDDGLGNAIYPADPNATRIRSFDYDEIHRALLGSVTSIDDTDSPYTLVRTQSLLLVDCTNGAVVVNLPAASDLAQMQFHIRKTAGAATNTITVTPAGTDTINGNATLVINFTGSVATIQSNGVDGWVTI